MGWIGDVIPRTTIRSVWGNGVRNQLVQIFDNRDWDYAPVQQEGMLGFSKLDNKFVYRDEAGWHWLADSLPPIWDTRSGMVNATFEYTTGAEGWPFAVISWAPALNHPSPACLWDIPRTLIERDWGIVTYSTSAQGCTVAVTNPAAFSQAMGSTWTFQYIAMSPWRLT